MTISNPLYNWRLAACSMLALVCIWVANVLAMPVPGTSIVNVGTAEYIDGSGQAQSITSNPAYVIVGEARSVDLEEDQFFPATPAQPVYYRHRLTNTGNVADSYTLSIDEITTDAGNFVRTRIFLDINEDGLPNAGEPEITQTRTLSPEEFIYLVIEAFVPASAEVGSEYSLTITATSTADSTVNDSNLDGVNITDEPVVLLNKSSSQSCRNDMIAGSELVYKIDFNSVGQKAPEAAAVTIDGQAASAVLIVDELPEQLELVQREPALAPRQGVFLIQREADVLNEEWISYANWDGQEVVVNVAAAFQAENMETNESGSFEFTTRVREDAAAGEFENRARIDLDNNDSFETVSNAVCNRVAQDLLFELAPDRAIRIPESDTVTEVQFQHTLTNTGGRRDSYDLEIIAIDTDSGNLTDIAIFLDNGDNELDESVDVLYSGQAFFVEAGQSQSLIVRALVPAGFVTGDEIQQNIQATSRGDASLVDSHSEIVTFRPAGVEINIQKETSRFCELLAEDQANQDTADRLLPNDLFSYSISFQNVGSEAPVAKTYTVDGNEVEGAILVDTLPYGLRLASAQNFDGVEGQVILMPYDNFIANTWISFDNWNGSDFIGRFGVLYSADQIASDTAHSVSFDVQVVETATSATEFYNRAHFDFDADGSVDVESNQVCNLVGESSDPDSNIPDAQLRFLSPTIDLILDRTPPEHDSDEQFIDTELYRLDTDLVTYNPATDGVFIEVTSTTLREGNDYIILADGRRQVVVDVQSLGTGDTAQVVLRETQAGSGVYRSIRTLVLSETERNGGGVCPTDQNSAIDFSAAATPECTLLAIQDDDLQVTLTDSGINKTLQDDAIVDPLGIVFDSVSKQPIAGAEVFVCEHLADGSGDVAGPCGQFGTLAVDPFSPSSETLAPQVTGDDGFYQFAFLFPGDYFLHVEPPETYFFPSSTSPEDFIGIEAVGRDRDLAVRDSSYGYNSGNGVFSLTAINPLLVVDLPVDPFPVLVNVANECRVDDPVAFNPDNDGERFTNEFTVPIRYQITFSKSDVGNIDITRAIDVNGAQQVGVLLESEIAPEALPILDSQSMLDVIPSLAGTLLSDPRVLDLPAGVSTADVTFLTQSLGQSANQWTAFTPGQAQLSLEQLQAISKIGILLPESAFPVNASNDETSAKFRFDVVIPDVITLFSIIENNVSIDADGDGVVDVSASSGCLGIGTGTPRIRFVAPTISIRKEVRDLIAANTPPNASSPPRIESDQYVDITQYIISNLSGSSYQPISDDVYVEMLAQGIPRQGLYLPDQRLLDGRRRVQIQIRSGETDQTDQVVGLSKTSISVGEKPPIDGADLRDVIQVILHETEEGSGIFRSVSPIVLTTDKDVNDPSNPPVCGDVYDDVATTIADISYWESQEGGSARDEIDCRLKTNANDDLLALYEYPQDALNNIASFGADISDIEQGLIDLAVVNRPSFLFWSDTGERIFDEEPAGGYVVEVLDDNGLVANSIFDEPLELEVNEADSSFSFVHLAAGTYSINVRSPSTSGAGFPSILTIPEVNANALAAGNTFDVRQSSFGANGAADANGSTVLGSGQFTVTDSEFASFDVPLDRNSNGALVIDKNVATSQVEVGGLVEYTIQIRNNGEVTLDNVRIEDSLPYGFKYVPRTARIDGTRIADPAGGLGPRLTFAVGQLGHAASDIPSDVQLSYYLQATAGAVDSDGINTAVGFGEAGVRTGDRAIASNVDREKVEIIQRGVLSDKAYIFGKVFVDVNCDNEQTEGEWPIGAVKLYMEDGTYAITDENGQYSLYGLEPGLHVIKVDPLTLPEGLTLKPIDNRHAADGDSRFVDLVDGEYHRADFAVACPAPALMEQVHQQIINRNRTINGNWMLEEAARFDPTRANQNVERRADSNGELGQGIIGSTNAGSDIITGVQQSPLIATNFNIADELTVKEDQQDKMPITQDIVGTVTAKQAKAGEFLWPKSDTSVYGRFMVVVRTGVSPALFVNGERVSDEKLGEQFINKRERAQVMAWYGVSLQPGPNLVEVKGKDPFGNLRVLAKGTFHSPGLATRLEVEALDKTVPADGGRSAAKVAIRVLDKFDRPARGIHFVTLDVSDGIWAETDIQDKTQGFQARVRGGETIMHLRSSEFTGTVDVVATTDEFEDKTEIDFVASNRSLVVSGVAEAGYHFGSINDDGYGPTAQKDGIGDNGVETRAALFMKGKIKGGMHLTLSYDTDKDSDTDLLRDINPNEYYPIPGDNSVRGFEAQSRSKLYAKIEKDRHSLLWGDYVTDAQAQHRDVARVSRTLTGARATYDDGKLQAQVFAAEEEDAYQELFLAANGTAMLYRIPGGNVARNSEVIEIVTYDRQSNNANPANADPAILVQPNGIELKRETLQRFIDYTVDYVTGDIRFTRSIPSLDSEANPNFIRIAYNRETGGEDNIVAGVRLAYDVNEKLTVGASHTQDDNDTTGTDVSGVFATITPNDSTKISLSAGTMSHNNATEDGNAMMAEVNKQWGDKGTTVATYGRAEQGFTNTGSGVSADNQQLRINHSQNITKDLKINGEFLNTEVLSSGDQRRNAAITADYRIKEWVVRAGTRRAEISTGGQDDTSDSMIVGIGRGFELFGRQGNVNLEHEQEVGQQERTRWTTDANWQVHEKAKLYGRYEQIDSILGGAGIASNRQTNGSFGIESTWIPSTTVYNEYRMRGVTDGRDLESATGIRGDVELEPGLRLNPSFEFIETMEGQRDNGSIAASLGITDSRDDNSRKSLRIESRLDEQRHYYGMDASYVARVSLNWSSFIREDLRVTENVGSDNELDHVLTVGLAHRPRLDNAYHSLWLYQWKLQESAVDREVHLFSTHQNWQVAENFILSGRFGIKFEEYDLLDTTFRTNVWMTDGRLIYDLTRRIDLDVHGGMLATNGIDELRYSVGLGVNFLLNRNIRVHTGYNFVGFEEHDLDGEGYNAQGFNIGLQYKFDEKLFETGAAQ